MENIIIVANVNTGEVIERSMTEAELTADSKHRAEVAKTKAEADAAAAVKEAARQALLDKLGITADEAKLLLG